MGDASLPGLVMPVLTACSCCFCSLSSIISSAWSRAQVRTPAGRDVMPADAQHELARRGIAVVGPASPSLVRSEALTSTQTGIAEQLRPVVGPQLFQQHCVGWCFIVSSCALVTWVGSENGCLWLQVGLTAHA